MRDFWLSWTCRSAVVFLLSSCGAGDEGTGPECVINLQCRADSLCLDGFCIQRFDGGPTDGGTTDGGIPSCPLGQLRCDEGCVNIQSDTNHCGGCGLTCGVGQSCNAGRCEDPCVPTTPALEVCDGEDNDCDGRTDPGCDPGLVVWYSFDGSGATATDISGNGHDATITSPAQQTSGGRLGGGLSLSGTGGFASTPGHADFALTSAFTAEAWVQPTSCTGHQGVASIEERIVLGLRNGDCRLHNFMHSNGTWKASKPAVAAQMGAWAHVALVWDGSNLVSYFNGNPIGEATPAAGPPTFSATRGLFVGDRPDCSSCPWPFQGTIDEFKLWSVPRTAAEVCQSIGGNPSAGGCITGG